MEPKMVALYESVLDEVEIGTGTRLLDIGYGPGLFLRLAAQRGASVTGIDAPPESLPYADDAFDVITGFNAFQFAADPARALREAARVADAGASVVIAAWGPAEQCEAAAYVEAVGSLIGPRPAGAFGPFALSGAGAIEDFAAMGGLTPGERHEVLCVWIFPDEDAVLSGLGSTGLGMQATQKAGEERVGEAILGAVAPFRLNDGGYRLENVFTYLVARA